MFRNIEISPLCPYKKYIQKQSCDIITPVRPTINNRFRRPHSAKLGLSYKINLKSADYISDFMQGYVRSKKNTIRFSANLRLPHRSESFHPCMLACGFSLFRIFQMFMFLEKVRIERLPGRTH